MAVGQLSKVIQQFRSVIQRQGAECMTDADLLKLYVRQGDEAAIVGLVPRRVLRARLIVVRLKE